MTILRAATRLAAAGGMLATLGQAGALAADVDLRVLGWYGNQPQQQDIEAPFWKGLEERTDGTFSAQFRTIDELGLTGFEALRTLQTGAFDVVSIQVSHVSGDDPLFMGADLPGLSYTFDELGELLEAYSPVLDARLQERYGAKLMAVWAYPPQILFCKGDITSLKDLAGQKVRVSSAFSAAAVEEFGGASITLAGPEVYQALLQGVADCSATGSVYGNVNGWHEVTDTLYPVPLGGSGVAIHTIRLDSWNKLTPEQQEVLTAEMKELGDALWQMGVDDNQDGINCNIGAEPCKNGIVGKMSLLEVTDEGRAEMKAALENVILPTWVEQCERVVDDCRAQWNETVGKILDIQL
ncbi:TRAP transporter substrate-binding protein [Acuticoccus sp. MNP-M23]|uniref:TRAP transporter substrate-binding protein n=1 Tax=Acuticoccus sp. MNP-M23 TaxID=3072793 RepID=UPI0028166160|nr:TRAP transporter substrate-binding protein [Acuticoccus sp. MNP-M23]WMS43545.1 TRAP transporter substrate-binding protein [Acuticoccus sp. MNP-M23]